MKNYKSVWLELNILIFQASGMPQDSKAAFKAEWEALEVTEHNWALKNCDQEMLSLVEPSPEHMYNQTIKQKMN